MNRIPYKTLSMEQKVESNGNKTKAKLATNEQEIGGESPQSVNI